MAKLFRQRPDLRIASSDGAVECGFRLGDLRASAGPFGRFETFEEFRQERDAVVGLVAARAAELGYDLPPEDIREVAARAHQVLIGRSGCLGPEQRQVYGLPREQDRFAVR